MQDYLRLEHDFSHPDLPAMYVPWDKNNRLPPVGTRIALLNSSPFDLLWATVTGYTIDDLNEGDFNIDLVLDEQSREYLSEHPDAAAAYIEWLRGHGWTEL